VRDPKDVPMLLAGKTRRDSKPIGAGVLNDLMGGKTVDEISESRSLTRMQVERILRAELKTFSIRPVQDYAKLQIKRLEQVVAKLTEKANDGDLDAVDRLMRMLDRLDRYHGFGKAATKDPKYDQRDEESFKRKLADLVARARKARAQNGDGSTASGAPSQEAAAP
jgi:predicted transcriptional regulator